MTKDEILAMEAGAALDDLIAKNIFNARTITKKSKLSDKTFYALIGGEKEQFQPLEKGRTLANVWWRHTEKEAWDACPSYSTDISAAWEVINKIQGEWAWDMVMINASQEVDVRIGRCRAASKNVPLAICKAALLAVME